MELTSQYCKVNSKQKNNVSFYERVKKLEQQYPYLLPQKSGRPYRNIDINRACYSQNLMERFPTIEQSEQELLDGDLHFQQFERQFWTEIFSNILKNTDQRIMEELDKKNTQPANGSSTNERGER
ncbi:hypothetical protein [Bacillus atrophaeus]|uniref:hypothetical protein n=1 Tax=Bacillus atrophaeus TaxID=1452 RepID=UPI00227F343E|nr:hypothetical protein [Bacillus atrophaeus]MCY8466600.1 hypothetical protein [Bacillus atrophaeus]MCY8479060.1 hypothetical protein [Bacillus atrophaeus]